MNEHTQVPTIDVATVAEHIEKQDAFVVDLRSTSHGEMIYGSIRYEPKKLAAAEKLMLPLPKGSGLIVLVDEDGKSERLTSLAGALARDGYGEIRALDGGFDAWKAAGGRMQERAMEQPIPDVTEHQITR
jgi:rhodanese-related sulfurtransferase